MTQKVQGSTSAFFTTEIDNVLKMNEQEFSSHFEHTQVVQISHSGGQDAQSVTTYSSLIV